MGKRKSDLSLDLLLPEPGQRSFIKKERPVVGAGS